MIEEDDQPVQITLRRDVALVLDAIFHESYESDTPLVINLNHEGDWGAIEELAGRLESQLYELFLSDHRERVNSARKRLQEKHGWPVGHEPSDVQG